jgi:hypothetical protein
VNGSSGATRHRGAAALACDARRSFPLAPPAEGLHRALEQDGAALAVENLRVSAAWSLVGLAVAVRWFRWEPQIET